MQKLIFLLLLPVTLFGGWVAENFLGGTWNPAGLVNETILSYRISFADKNSFVFSEAHLDLGAFISIFPTGCLFAGRIKFSPLIFLDVGFAAGAHTCWEFYAFPDGTTTYSENVRDRMSPGSEIIPYISPFWIVKLKFGPLILYNSLFLERFFYRKLWYYWYPELMVRDDWIFYWNSCMLLELSPEFLLMLKGHLQKSYDTADTRYHIGPGVRFNVFDGNTWLIATIEYHFKEVNFSGLKLSAGLETSFSW